MTRKVAALIGYRLMIWRMDGIGRSRIWRLGDRLASWGQGETNE